MQVTINVPEAIALAFRKTTRIAGHSQTVILTAAIESYLAKMAASPELPAGDYSIEDILPEYGKKEKS